MNEEHCVHFVLCRALFQSTHQEVILVRWKDSAGDRHADIFATTPHEVLIDASAREDLERAILADGVLALEGVTPLNVIANRALPLLDNRCCQRIQYLWLLVLLRKNNQNVTEAVIGEISS